MKQPTQKIWFYIAILCSILVAIYTLPNIITHPGTNLIMVGGDAGKNYSSYLYHILYEKGAQSYFMNYPYGDNILYMDGLPALSIPLSYLNQIIPVSAHTALAVMHWALCLSYILAILFTYKTLRVFSITPAFAIVFSCLIIIMSPQLFRLTWGHFGLGYNFLLPMVFYWTLKYHQKRKIKYPFFIFITGIIAIFLHPYFLAILTVWLAGYIIGTLIFKKTGIKEKLRNAASMFVILLMLPAIFKFFLFLTDPVKDRPQYPWGTLEYRTSLTQIFTSTHTGPWQFAHDQNPAIPVSDGGEGYAYIGLTAICVCFISIVILFANFLKKKKTVNNDCVTFPPVFIFMAIFALCLAMGIPFIWHMEWLLNYVSLFRQFRSIGRFNWIFYYIITVFAVYQIQQWHLQWTGKNKKRLAYLTLLLPMLLWIYETSGYLGVQRHELEKSHHFYEMLFLENEKDADQFLAVHHFSKNSFQALIMLPYVHVGSDKLWLGNFYQGWQMTFTGGLAIKWHLPITDALSARISWAQTFKQVKTISGPAVNKPIFNTVSDKPFLLFYEQKDSLDPDTKYLLAASDYIGNYSGNNFYACYPNRVKENDKKFINSFQAAYNDMSVGDTCFDLSPHTAKLLPLNYHVDHFNNGNSEQSLCGNRAHSPTAQNIEDNFFFYLTPQYDSQLYEFSLWALVNDYDYRSPYFRVYMMDSLGKTIAIQEVNTSKSVDNYGFWLRTSAYMHVPAACRVIKCEIINEPYPSYLALDEAVMRPANTITISKYADGVALVNNHFYKK